MFDDNPQDHMVSLAYDHARLVEAEELVRKVTAFAAPSWQRDAWRDVLRKLHDLANSASKRMERLRDPGELNAEEVARAFHEVYEGQAPDHDYKTRKASAVPWEDVPDKNKRLMVSVVTELARRGVIRRGGSV